MQLNIFNQQKKILEVLKRERQAGLNESNAQIIIMCGPVYRLRS